MAPDSSNHAASHPANPQPRHPCRAALASIPSATSAIAPGIALPPASLQSSYHFLVPWRQFTWCILGLTLLGLTACTSGSKLIDHAFEFRAVSDSPEVEVLNYRYGDSNLPGTRMPPALLRDGGVSGGTGINGPMPRGDSLYVKWRIKATGEVFEYTVDLKKRLPDDITGQRIYFVIDGSQVYVYLISRDPIRGYLSEEEVQAADREATTPHKKALRKYIRHKIITIYPNQLKPQEAR